MLTRCPECTTHFRVTPEQLKARSGRVRCGACQAVFNALDSLIEQPRPATAPPRPEPAGDSSVESVANETDTESSAASPVGEVAESPVGAQYVPLGAFEPLSERTVDIPVVPETSVVPEVPAEPWGIPPPPISGMPEPVAAESSVDENESAPELVIETKAIAPATKLPKSAGPDFDQRASAFLEAETVADPPAWSETFPDPPPSPRRWPWIIGSLVALVALGLQAALAFRVEMVVLWPETRPALVALCDIAQCEVGLPTRIGLVGIEASDLFPDSGNNGRLALTATLKSRAPFAQQFPHIELTLTDTSDLAIARRVLAPSDYLPPSISVSDGMVPNADIAIAIGIEATGLSASGYRLYLFYP